MNKTSFVYGVIVTNRVPSFSRFGASTIGAYLELR